MVELPKRKVGIVSCSGEELPEGTISRLATLKAMNELRSGDTVTICLPLFLAGGEGDRAFARFYPTIAVDGCDLRCAARGTEMYSGKPAASIVVRDVIAENHLDQPEGRRRLNEPGIRAVDATAERIARLVDELLGKHWDRTDGTFIEASSITIGATVNEQAPAEATCACGSGIPVKTVEVNGEAVTLTALPLIFEQFHQAGKAPSESVAQELLDTARIYNAVPAALEGEYLSMLLREYRAYCEKAGTA
ncbi:MAG TPA: putative zinc-binding protein [Anaerolineales bacterium]